MEKKHKHRAQNSWGVYDVYKHIRKKGWYDIGRPVTEHEFYTIVRQINLLLAENIANGETVKFPERMGHLELRKFKVGVDMVNGKMVITYPIDWLRTKQLWKEDKEACEKKILLRHENQYVYHVKYCTVPANYDNKGFYQFMLNGAIKKAISKHIKEGTIDTIYGTRNTIY